jgi:hypothetical protein
VLEESERNSRKGVKEVKSRFNYRGQPFEFLMFPHSVYRDLGFSFRFNVMFGRADEWLTADRSNVALGASEELRGILTKALQEKIRKDDFAGDSEERRRMLSLFLAEMAFTYGREWSSISSEFGDQWQQVVFARGNLTELLRSGNWTFTKYMGEEVDDNFSLVVADRSPTIEQIVFKAWLEGRKANSITAHSYREFLGEKAWKEFSEMPASPRVSNFFKREDWKSTLVYEMSKGRREPYTLEALRARLPFVAAKGYGNKRFLLPLSKHLKEWGDLTVRQDVSKRFYKVFDNVRDDHVQILLPFLFKKSYSTNLVEFQATCDDAFCEQVRGLLNKDLSLEHVRALYQKLIDYIDDLMSDIPEWKAVRL